MRNTTNPTTSNHSLLPPITVDRRCHGQDTTLSTLRKTTPRATPPRKASTSHRTRTPACRRVSPWSPETIAMLSLLILQELAEAASQILENAAMNVTLPYPLQTSTATFLDVLHFWIYRSTGKSLHSIICGKMQMSAISNMTFHTRRPYGTMHLLAPVPSPTDDKFCYPPGPPIQNAHSHPKQRSKWQPPIFLRPRHHETD